MSDDLSSKAEDARLLELDQAVDKCKQEVDSKSKLHKLIDVENEKVSIKTKIKRMFMTTLYIIVVLGTLLIILIIASSIEHILQSLGFR